MSTTIILGELPFTVGVPYTIAGTFGSDNGRAYARLANFKDERINMQGLSDKHPGYHFAFTLVETLDYEHGIADIYQFVITRKI